MGAVLTSESGDLVAVGATDAPRFSGGLDWSGANDQRDDIKGTVPIRRIRIGACRSAVLDSSPRAVERDAGSGTRTRTAFQPGDFNARG